MRKKTTCLLAFAKFRLETKVNSNCFQLFLAFCRTLDLTFFATVNRGKGEKNVLSLSFPTEEKVFFLQLRVLFNGCCKTVTMAVISKGHALKCFSCGEKE